MRKRRRRCELLCMRSEQSESMGMGQQPGCGNCIGSTVPAACHLHCMTHLPGGMSVGPSSLDRATEGSVSWPARTTASFSCREEYDAITGGSSCEGEQDWR